MAGASIIAIPDWSNPDAVVGTATLSTPLAAWTALAKAIMAMPAPGPALARTMVAVNLKQAVAKARRLPEPQRGRAGQ